MADGQHHEAPSSAPSNTAPAPEPSESTADGLLGDALQSGAASYYAPIVLFVLGILIFASLRKASSVCKRRLEQLTARKVLLRRGLCASCSSSARSTSAAWRLLSLDFRVALLDMNLGGLLFVFGFMAATATHVWFKSQAVQEEGLKSMPLARGFGTAATLSLAFLTLPTSHTTAWLRLMGIPFEKAVQFHRICARVSLGCMWAHGLLATFEFGLSKVFTLSASEGHPPLYGVIAVLLFTVMAILALEPVRRSRFEVFLYSHMCFPIALLLAVLHNRSLAVYGFPAAALYAVDLILRLKRRCTPVVVARAQERGSFVVLELRAPGFQWQPGQYVLLNVPSASKLQWHPASICAPMAPAADGDPLVKLCIKRMPAGTWTDDVAKVIAAHKDLGRELGARLDGPLGKIGVDVRDYATLVLVAGGIGVTPLICALTDIANREAAGTLPLLTRVLFVWSVRDVELVDELLPQLLAAADVCGRIEVAVHVSGVRSGSAASMVPPSLRVPHVRLGRPDVLQLIAKEAHDLADEPRDGGVARGAVLTCGPPALTHAVTMAAKANDFDTHTETFEL